MLLPSVTMTTLPSARDAGRGDEIDVGVGGGRGGGVGVGLGVDVGAAVGAAESVGDGPGLVTTDTIGRFTGPVPSQEQSAKQAAGRSGVRALMVRRARRIR